MSSTVKEELVILISGVVGIPSKEYFNDEEALLQFSKTPFIDFFVAVGDEIVEYPASRPRGYYLKTSTINLILFCKDNIRDQLQININTIYDIIFKAKHMNYWNAMPYLLQAKALASEKEVSVNDKVFYTIIPVEITELINSTP